MLTPRAWWFLFWTVGLGLQAIGWLAYYAPSVGVFAVTLLFAVAAEAALFHLRTQTLARRLVVTRTLLQGGRVVPTLWAGVAATVRVRVELLHGLPLPFVQLAETLPHGVPKVEGRRRIVTRLAVGAPVEIVYTLVPEAPGAVRFEGVEVRVADLMGFFHRRLYLRNPVEVPVLPPLSAEDGGRRGTKRFNALPPPGEHRLRRPGGGGELLDLRDYRPGDPPKTIAWKASARRDRLITKEFETDVPVKCAIFLDASAATRLGEPGRTPLARMAATAAGVAQAAAGNRDLVGLTVFDEATAATMRPARTRGHTLRLLRAFAEAAARPPENTETDPRVLQRHAHSLAQELYPDLLDKRWNSRPFGLFWLPLLDTRWSRWLLVPLALQLLLLNLTGFNLAVEVARDVVEPRAIWDVILMLPLIAAVMLAPTLLTLGAWVGFGLRGFLPGRARELSKRKQLAALYAARYGDGPAGVERAIHDDAFFADRSGRFLADHRRTLPPRLLDDRGRNRFRGESKLDVVGTAIRRAAAVSRDNELYVIFLEPTDLADRLEPLVRAVRAARARHHQVVVLLAEPPDLPAPPPPDRKVKTTLGEVIRASLADGYRDNLDHVGRELVRAGAALVRLDSATDSTRTVLARLERLRGGRAVQ